MAPSGIGRHRNKKPAYRWLSFFAEPPNSLNCFPQLVDGPTSLYRKHAFWSAVRISEPHAADGCPLRPVPAVSLAGHVHGTPAEFANTWVAMFIKTIISTMAPHIVLADFRMSISVIALLRWRTTSCKKARLSK
jgi:hypothetical protein